MIQNGPAVSSESRNTLENLSDCIRQYGIGQMKGVHRATAATLAEGLVVPMLYS